MVTSRRRSSKRSKRSNLSKRSKRSNRRATRRHHHKGGARLSPQELLDAFARAHEKVKSISYTQNKASKEARDALFDEIKDEFYKDNVPSMKKGDWYDVLVNTGGPDHNTIKKRIDDVIEVMRFWLAVRREKVANKNVGFKFSRVFRANNRAEKQVAAVKEATVFYHFLVMYLLDAESRHSPHVAHYKEEIAKLKGTLEMNGAHLVDNAKMGNQVVALNMSHM